MDPKAERLPPQVETALFCIVQEAVNNGFKHTGTRRVEITLAQSDGFVTLGAADDGQGFDPDAARLILSEIELLEETAPVESVPVTFPAETRL